MAGRTLPNTSLPFFAYGMFKPNEIAWPRIADFAEQTRNCSIQGELRIRDGLLLVTDGSSSVEGSLVRFLPGKADKGYEAIDKLEPHDLYGWRQDQAFSEPDGSREPANVLYGKSPKQGSYPFDETVRKWRSRDDPLFTTALDVVADVAKASTGDEERDFFHSLMAYLLLWSAIERFATLRYRIGRLKQGDAVLQRVLCVAGELSFISALKQSVPPERKCSKVHDTRNPSCKEVLDVNRPEKAMKYYYQVRSNIVHRGKSAYAEWKLVRDSLVELSAIFGEVLNVSLGDRQPE